MRSTVVWDRPGEAGQLIRSKARTFYLSSLFLPQHIRRDVHLVYAYYRAVDDLVDESPDWTRADILDALSDWEDGLQGRRTVAIPLLHAVSQVTNRYNIECEHLTMVLEGARMDLDLRAVETSADLRRYAVLVAGSVGMVMAPILGARGEHALTAACDLGVAMQLTNILRDVGEDLQRGRVYLPREELGRAGVSSEMLRSRVVTPELRTVLRGVAKEAREQYAQGIAGIQELDPSVRFSIYVAATLYSLILTKIEEGDFDVFTRRAHLGSFEKWALALPAYVRHRRLSGRVPAV